MPVVKYESYMVGVKHASRGQSRVLQFRALASSFINVKAITHNLVDRTDEVIVSQ